MAAISFRFSRPAALGLALAGAAAGLFLAPVPAARAAESAVPPPRLVLLRVKLDAVGKVTESRSIDESTVPTLVQAGREIAGKLTFTPATKKGRPVASETSLQLTLAFVPRAAGGFGISLARAQSGPSITVLGHDPGTFGGERSGKVSASVDLGPEGAVDMKTFKVEGEADAAMEKAARASLNGTVFMLDKVDGYNIPARVTVDFDFAAKEPPSLTAVSKIDDIVLPRVDYKK